jgi:hypothetical protein
MSASFRAYLSILSTILFLGSSAGEGAAAVSGIVAGWTKILGSDEA